ncbi:hypothetical protein [Clostridium sp. KNHs205]|uniref:hypothetical protein n=1 Tax=Clostridium sp. KNHs205 TaxID=1449050 RepID=UPI00051BB701|nr:hypothetical protein [Clostridium sp. KNHs205]
MLREEVLNSSRELVNKIYEKMNVIEICDSVAEKVKNLDVCFNDPDGKQVVSLDGILTADQLTVIRDGIIDKIYDNAAIAQSFLEKLNRKPATVNPVFEEAVQDMEKSSKGKASGRKSIDLDIDQVKELYVNQGLSFRKVADQCGCSENTVRNFAMKHNITREASEPVGYPVMTVEAVRKVYTDGSMSLADTAKYFGIESTKLHTFIEKNNLKKVVVKPKDPFMDANKMGKDEFKRQMLAGKK